MDGYSLRFRTPNGTPLQTIDINPLVTTVEYSTGQGGYTVMSVGMVPGLDRPVTGTLDPPQIIPPFADVTLYKGTRPIWRGMVVEFADDDPSMTTGFVAEGYGTGAYMASNWSRATTTGASTSGVVLSTILVATTPKLRPGQGDEWQNPGVTHSLNDFYKMTAGEIIDQITKEGAIDGSLVDFYVWDDLIARLIKRRTPAQPEYRIQFDRRVRRSRDYRTAYGAAMIEFLVGGSTITLTAESYSPAFESEFGIQRFRFVPAGKMTAEGAVAYRDAQLANSAGATVSFTITRDGGDGMERWDGGMQPFELVRAGEWVKVGDDLPLPIVATSVDLTNRSLTIELGAPSPYMPKNFFVKQRSLSDTWRRLINPVVGGRMR